MCFQKQITSDKEKEISDVEDSFKKHIRELETKNEQLELRLSNDIITLREMNNNLVDEVSSLKEELSEINERYTSLGEEKQEVGSPMIQIQKITQ